ncbi:MAG: ThiF family adenylyltransferase [Planctomycetota bacterium]|jgi:molybdopterin/thiamine biosynthesis adenylyltransferase
MTVTQKENKIKAPFEPILKDHTSVKLIGLGGVGSIVARYLTIFLASLDKHLRLVLIDGDAYEPTNAGRMLFSEHGNKAAVTCADLLVHFADSFLAMVAIQEYVTPANIDRLIHNGDIVILAVDNHATRKLVSDFCSASLDDVCLISGGNDGVGRDASNQITRGTYGNCQIYIRSGGQDLNQRITSYHPEIRKPADKNPSEENCTELMQSVPQILFANLAAASAILNAFWLYCCDALHYSELAFDIADGLMRPVLPLTALMISSHNVKS